METRKPFWKYLVLNLCTLVVVFVITIPVICVALLVEQLFGLPKNSHLVLLVVGWVLFFAIKEWGKQE